MTTASLLIDGLDKLFVDAGINVRIDYFNVVSDPIYDTQISLTLSGTAFSSGIILPINGGQGSSEARLLEQGKITTHDIKAYFKGNLDLTNDNMILKFHLGSPTGDKFSLLDLGIHSAEVLGSPVYQKAFLRLLPTGSLYGE